MRRLDELLEAAREGTLEPDMAASPDRDDLHGDVILSDPAAEEDAPATAEDTRARVRSPSLEEILLPSSDEDSASDSSDESDDDGDADDDEDADPDKAAKKLMYKLARAGRKKMKASAEKAKATAKGKGVDSSSQHRYRDFGANHRKVVSDMAQRFAQEMTDYCDQHDLNPTSVWAHADGILPNHSLTAWKAFLQCRGTHRSLKGLSFSFC